MDVSFKAVLFDDAGRVLLGTNPRDEWELLGGRADPEDSGPADTITRELVEEAGVCIRVDHLIDIWYYDIPHEGRVAVASYLAHFIGPATIQASHEHSRLAFFSIDELDRLLMPSQYATTIRAAATYLHDRQQKGIQ